MLMVMVFQVWFWTAGIAPLEQQTCTQWGFLFGPIDLTNQGLRVSNGLIAGLLALKASAEGLILIHVAERTPRLQKGAETPRTTYEVGLSPILLLPTYISCPCQSPS